MIGNIKIINISNKIFMDRIIKTIIKGYDIVKE